MTREFNVIIEKDEDGYFVASVPSLRGCHTQAKSLDVLIKRIKEAIEVTRHALKNNKVKEAAGFFVEAVKQGYSNKGLLKDKKQLTLYSNKPIQVRSFIPCSCILFFKAFKHI